jgi:integrase
MPQPRLRRGMTLKKQNPTAPAVRDDTLSLPASYTSTTHHQDPVPTLDNTSRAEVACSSKAPKRLAVSMVRNRWERATRISEGSHRDGGAVFRCCGGSAVRHRHSRNAQPRRSADQTSSDDDCGTGQHFQHRELARDDNWRSYSTRRNYEFNLRKWIIPRWGNYELGEVRTIEVESWLRSLPLARSSCAKIRNLMSVLFNHAWRHELFDRNPIKLVRQSAKRRAAPNVLAAAEIKLLLDHLELRERTLVLVAASTDLRQSELFALKWGDIDFSQGTMNVTRSIAYGIVGQCKIEASQKPVPVHSILVEELTQWRDRCRYREPDHWVFANEHHRGRHPYWGQAILRGIIRPVAERIGIKKRIGWHTFRHYAVFRTMPNALSIRAV